MYATIELAGCQTFPHPRLSAEKRQRSGTIGVHTAIKKIIRIRTNSSPPKASTSLHYFIMIFNFNRQFAVPILYSIIGRALESKMRPGKPRFAGCSFQRKGPRSKGVTGFLEDPCISCSRTWSSTIFTDSRCKGNIQICNN